MYIFYACRKNKGLNKDFSNESTPITNLCSHMAM